MHHIVTMRVDKAVKFFHLAQTQAALFSKDPHHKVGTLFVDPESLAILSTGYNGFCRGIDETCENRWDRPQKYDFVCHAEVNGIYNACRQGVRLNGSTAVVTTFPCLECAKALIQVGVRTVVSRKPDFADERWGRQFKMSTEMFEEVGMKLLYVDPHLPRDEPSTRAGGLTG